MSVIGVPELFIVGFLWLLILWPWWRIFSKAGYPGWFAFSQLIPLLNLIALFYLAFSEWPSRRRLDM